jgi:RND family efflux transporter MFP subunit
MADTGLAQYIVLSTQYWVRTRIVIFLLVAPALLILLGSVLLPCTARAQSSSLEVVQAGKPQRKTLLLTTAQPARMEAIEQAPMHSKLAAYVAEVLVDYGDVVKKNQPLVKLTAPELDAELAQKQALREQAKAELAQAEAGAKAAEAAIGTASAKVAQAQASLGRVQADSERWRAEYARIEQLATSGSVNRQLVDETQQKHRAAEAAVSEYRAAIDAANAGISQAQAEAARSSADVVAATSRVQVADANVNQVEATRSYLTIRAPFDGVVTQRRVDPGYFVQPASGNGGPLIMVARIDKIRVLVAVPESEAGYVDLGDPVTIEVQSLRGAEIKGQVTRTGFALDPGSRSLETIIDLDNSDGRLRPGLFATAKILLQERKDTLVLPAAAVVRQGKEAACYRLIGGKAAKTPIQVGIKVADEFEVASGLSEADTVILNKAASLKDGQAVEVAKVEAKK